MSEPAEPVSMDARFTEMHRMVAALAAERDEWRSHAQEAGANLDRVAADLHLSERFVTELRRQLEVTEARAVRYRVALEVVLSGDVSLTMDGPHPGIGLDYSYVRATPEVMVTLAEVNRLAILHPPKEPTTIGKPVKW